MLDLVKDETERLDATFLEPACGDGNFLDEVLRRKLAVCRRRYGRSATDYEKFSFLACTTLYGVDILADNVARCRERLFARWEGSFAASPRGDADASPAKPDTPLASPLPTSYHEKVARRNVSLKLLSMTKEQLEKIAVVMDEQNNYDPLESTVNDVEYIDRNNDTELFFDSLVEVGEPNGEFDARSVSSTGRGGRVTAGDGAAQCRRARRSAAPKRKARTEKKPRRQRSTLLQRLEKARDRARRTSVN